MQVYLPSFQLTSFHSIFTFSYNSKYWYSFLGNFNLSFSVQAACGGVIRGAGKQKVGAICNIVGYYGIGFPIGLPLMFVAKLGIKGRIHFTTLSPVWG